MDKIAAAFIKAKKDFGPVLKGKNNPAFKSKYANLEACLDAVDDACLAHGIALYQETFEDAAGVTVETVFLHESGESLRCGKLHVPASKQDPQGYGSALTYARRYSILTACGIAAEDDDGNAASRPAPSHADTKQRETRQPAQRQPLNQDQVAKELDERVAKGDVPGVADFLAGMPEKEMSALWNKLAAKSMNAVNDYWNGVKA